jgi:hypothetical protein
VREVVSSTLLRETLNLDYLHSGVSAILNSQMMNSLGVQTLNTHHLLEVGKHIVARLSGAADDNEGTWSIQKLHCFSIDPVLPMHHLPSGQNIIVIFVLLSAENIFQLLTCN